MISWLMTNRVALMLASPYEAASNNHITIILYDNHLHYGEWGWRMDTIGALAASLGIRI